MANFGHSIQGIYSSNFFWHFHHLMMAYILMCYGRFGSHLCEKQERNVVKKYVLLKQRRTGKNMREAEQLTAVSSPRAALANLPKKVKVVRDKMAMAQFQWLLTDGMTRKCASNFFAKFRETFYSSRKNSLTTNLNQITIETRRILVLQTFFFCKNDNCVDCCALHCFAKQ